MDYVKLNPKAEKCMRVNEILCPKEFPPKSLENGDLMGVFCIDLPYMG